MSWGEVFKINSNMKKPLNEQLREARFLPLRIITSNATFTPEKTGIYKVICVGAGGSGTYYGATDEERGSGGSGGVAIKTVKLVKGTGYSVTVGTTASFSYGSGSLTATAGTATSIVYKSYEVGAAGTASGGDYNYAGQPGNYQSSSTQGSCPTPGSVGVFISELSRSSSRWVVLGGISTEILQGNSILGYGGGGSAAFRAKTSTESTYDWGTTPGLPAAVIIIPLEMEG